jgi:hypothetical protein
VRSTLHVGRLARRDDRPRIGAWHARVNRSEVITPEGGTTDLFVHPSDQRIGLPKSRRGGERLLRGGVSPSRAAVAWALGTGPEIYRHIEVANCSITTVGVVAGVRRLVRMNENAQLEGLALER